MSKVRVEVSMKVAGSLFRGAQVARQVGRDVLSCLAFRTISYDEFVQELERMVDLAGYSGRQVGWAATITGCPHCMCNSQHNC